MHGRRCDSAGFSVIELVLTLLVMGIVAAVAAPKYVDAQRSFQLRAAARRVAADLEYARRQAQLKGRPQSVNFHVATSSYQLSGVAHLDSPSQTYAVALTTSEHPAAIRAVAFGAIGTDTAITFDLYGRPDFPGSVVLTLGGDQQTVTVLHTGKVDIEP